LKIRYLNLLISNWLLSSARVGNSGAKVLNFNFRNSINFGVKVNI
jgi:hypothetical protein